MIRLISIFHKDIFSFDIMEEFVHL